MGRSGRASPLRIGGELAALLLEAVEALERRRFDLAAIAAHARTFDAAVFRRAIGDFVASQVAGRRSEGHECSHNLPHSEVATSTFDL